MTNDHVVDDGFRPVPELEDLAKDVPAALTPDVSASFSPEDVARIKEIEKILAKVHPCLDDVTRASDAAFVVDAHNRGDRMGLGNLLYSKLGLDAAHAGAVMLVLRKRTRVSA